MTTENNASLNEQQQQLHHNQLCLLQQMNQQLKETLNWFSSYVDPNEATLGPDGLQWNQVGSDLNTSQTAGLFQTEQQLHDVRSRCRKLALNNEFAINGHENRISYIVGSGHTYTAVAKRGQEASGDLIQQVQEVVDQFIEANDWHRRQQEIVRRNDRDGESFLRYFIAEGGLLRIRFVEPSQISKPPQRTEPFYSFGIQTDPQDVETVRAYWIDGKAVDAAEIQHRKSNVDFNVKRGIPLFWPVEKNLIRAEKILRNMSMVTEIQSAIALIRRHVQSSKTTIAALTTKIQDAQLTNSTTGRTIGYQSFAPGTIIDAPTNVEYDFPAHGLDPSKPIAALQAELRAVASRLVMPEFMLTSDASNANYASTLVSEGPAVKSFQRLQTDQIAFDRQVIYRAIQTAANAARLPEDWSQMIHLQIEPPRLSVRDPLQEVQRDQILIDLNILSPQTAAARHQLNYKQEQENIHSHRQLVPTLQRGNTSHDAPASDR